MKATEIINYTAVSELLTKSSINLRKNKIPKKHAKAVAELEVLIQYWIDKRI